MLVHCADEQPYLQNYIKRASDAIMISCDPYNQGVTHTCLAFSSAYAKKILVYDATAEEFVLGPTGFFPLNIPVGLATNKLVRVSSSNKKFPYFLALDQAKPALYAIRSFNDSFRSPVTQNLDSPHKPYDIAAWQSDDQVIALVTYRDDQSIAFITLDSQTGAIKTQSGLIKLGVKPSHVVVDPKTKFAVISDEESNDIYYLDLANKKNILTGTPPIFNNININMPSNKIYLQARDFGNGQKNYLVASEAHGKKIKLINIDDKKVEDTLTLTEDPQALYFPDDKSEPCCNKKSKNWIAIVDMKNKLYYYIIKNNNK